MCGFRLLGSLLSMAKGEVSPPMRLPFVLLLALVSRRLSALPDGAEEGSGGEVLSPSCLLVSTGPAGGRSVRGKE